MDPADAPPRSEHWTPTPNGGIGAPRDAEADRLVHQAYAIIEEAYAREARTRGRWTKLRVATSFGGPTVEYSATGERVLSFHGSDTSLERSERDELASA